METDRHPGQSFLVSKYIEIDMAKKASSSLYKKKVKS